MRKAPEERLAGWEFRRCRFDPWVWKIPWRRKWWDFSSPTRNRTHTPCIGRQKSSPLDQTAREVPIYTIDTVYIQLTAVDLPPKPDMGIENLTPKGHRISKFRGKGKAA